MTKLYYDARNKKNIAKLADHTRAAAEKWYKYCEANNINVLIYETIRTLEQQKENVKNGVSQTLQSYHLTGQALDFVLCDKNGKTLWNAYHKAEVQKAVKYAKSLGFEWGGDWTSFIDSPHLQFNYKGYGTDTFNGKLNISNKVKAASSKTKYTSLVDYLKDHNMNSSFPARVLLAKKYNIKNYTGSAAQNTKLLAALQK